MNNNRYQILNESIYHITVKINLNLNRYKIDHKSNRLERQLQGTQFCGSICKVDDSLTKEFLVYYIC